MKVIYIAGRRNRTNHLRCLGAAVVWQQAAFALETLSDRARRAASTGGREAA